MIGWVFEGVQDFRYLGAVIDLKKFNKWWNKIKDFCRL